MEMARKRKDILHQPACNKRSTRLNNEKSKHGHTETTKYFWHKHPAYEKLQITL